jgi:hypothetical protein
MSAESQSTGQEPRNTDVSFEPRDIQVGSIYGYMLALAAATIAAFIICVFILRFTRQHAAAIDTPPPPSREAQGKDFGMPPEPRLQGVPGHEADPQRDLRNKIKADTQANEKFDWIDKNSGVAQIPVKDAMRIIAEKGLPATSAAQPEKKK